ncbi:tetratricopeptide repeat protein [Aliiroseovarius sp. YM-037]|uniref:tetratricopeptide repeat protein n=1 Tax=Aliiroseovarius sp. YM-037 TaxID=3341728 RepID=UPI003A8119FD
MIPTKTIFSTLAAATIATMSFAAGSDSTSPPVRTQTTQECENGQIWDERKGACVNPQSGALSDDDLYDAARELAYDGQYDNALTVLDLAENQNDPRILNYRGFANRKAGRIEEGMTYYQAALNIDPDYILARSYMGQALISDGDIEGAKAQLREIEMRGGEETWAYAALEQALGGESTDW